MILDFEQLEKVKEAIGPEAANEFLKLQGAEREKERQKAKRRANKDFTQVYPAGWHRLQELITKDPSAARLYVFLAENMGADGAICASRVTLADALGCSERTITRHVKFLEAEQAIVTLKVGTANVYCLDPSEVWKSFNEAKHYAAFRTKTLVGKKENPFTKRRLATLIGKEPIVPVEGLDLEEDIDEKLRNGAER